LSQIHTDTVKFGRVYCAVLASIAAVAFPLMGGIWCSTDYAVQAFLGEHWTPAINLIYILLPVGMVQSVWAPVGLIYQSRGRTDVQFVWSLISSTLIVLSFCVGLRWGVLGVGLAYSVSSSLLLIPSILLAFGLVELHLSAFMKAISMPLWCTFAMVATIALVRMLLGAVIPVPASLAAALVAGTAVYLALMWSRGPAAVQLLLSQATPRPASL
jgi:PST family polysaccharide transporter